MTTTIRKTRLSPLLMLSLGLLIVALAGCGSSPAATTEMATPEPTIAVVAAAPTAPPQAEVETEAASSATETVPETAASPENTDGQRTFVIDAARSQVRFYIDEQLLGQPKRVEGINDQVAGQVTVNLGNFAEIDFSPITIAADGFVTDSDRRNGAIDRFILQTGQYPTITFTPTGVENLPADIAVGQPFSFSLVGNLTIRDITSQETLAMTVTPVSADELSGSGSVTVLRETYQLTIPNVPSVANVSEEVLLEIDFVAVGK